MNPYERRIIHSALQNDKFCDTHSEGEEPYRKVVITPKKGFKEYSPRRNNYNRDSSYRKDYKKKFSDSYKKSFQSINLDDVRGEKSE
jgi:spoIIIJ-associated protein